MISWILASPLEIFFALLIIVSFIFLYYLEKRTNGDLSLALTYGRRIAIILSFLVFWVSFIAYSGLTTENRVYGLYLIYNDLPKNIFVSIVFSYLLIFSYFGVKKLFQIEIYKRQYFSYKSILYLIPILLITSFIYLEILERVTYNQLKSSKIADAELENISNSFMAKIDSRIQAKIALSDKISTEELMNMSKSVFKEVRGNAAKNSKTPKEILINLSNDRSSLVRTALAFNENIPSEILDKLSHENSDVVRVAVSENKSLSLDTIERLSKDNTPYVRYNMARNPSTPQQILETLITDKTVVDFTSIHPFLNKMQSNILEILFYPFELIAVFEEDCNCGSTYEVYTVGKGTTRKSK